MRVNRVLPLSTSHLAKSNTNKAYRNLQTEQSKQGAKNWLVILGENGFIYSCILRYDLNHSKPNLIAIVDYAHDYGLWAFFELVHCNLLAY